MTMCLCLRCEPVGQLTGVLACRQQSLMHKFLESDFWSSVHCSNGTKLSNWKEKCVQQESLFRAASLGLFGDQDYFELVREQLQTALSCKQAAEHYIGHSFTKLVEYHYGLRDTEFYKAIGTEGACIVHPLYVVAICALYGVHAVFIEPELGLHSLKTGAYSSLQYASSDYCELHTCESQFLPGGFGCFVLPGAEGLERNQCICFSLLYGHVLWPLVPNKLYVDRSIVFAMNCDTAAFCQGNGWLVYALPTVGAKEVAKARSTDGDWCHVFSCVRCVEDCRLLALNSGNGYHYSTELLNFDFCAGDIDLLRSISDVFLSTDEAETPDELTMSSGSVDVSSEPDESEDTDVDHSTGDDGDLENDTSQDRLSDQSSDSVYSEHSEESESSLPEGGDFHLDMKSDTSMSSASVEDTENGAVPVISIREFCDRFSQQNLSKEMLGYRRQVGYGTSQTRLALHTSASEDFNVRPRFQREGLEAETEALDGYGNNSFPSDSSESVSASMDIDSSVVVARMATFGPLLDCAYNGAVRLKVGVRNPPGNGPGKSQIAVAIRDGNTFETVLVRCDAIDWAPLLEFEGTGWCCYELFPEIFEHRVVNQGVVRATRAPAVTSSIHATSYSARGATNLIHPATREVRCCLWLEACRLAGADLTLPSEMLSSLRSTLPLTVDFARTLGNWAPDLNIRTLATVWENYMSLLSEQSAGNWQVQQLTSSIVVILLKGTKAAMPITSPFELAEHLYRMRLEIPRHIAQQRTVDIAVCVNAHLRNGEKTATFLAADWSDQWLKHSTQRSKYPHFGLPGCATNWQARFARLLSDTSLINRSVPDTIDTEKHMGGLRLRELKARVPYLAVQRYSSTFEDCVRFFGRGISLEILEQAGLTITPEVAGVAAFWNQMGSAHTTTGISSEDRIPPNLSQTLVTAFAESVLTADCSGRSICQEQAKSTLKAVLCLIDRMQKVAIELMARDIASRLEMTVLEEDAMMCYSLLVNSVEMSIRHNELCWMMPSLVMARLFESEIALFATPVEDMLCDILNACKRTDVPVSRAMAVVLPYNRQLLGNYMIDMLRFYTVGQFSIGASSGLFSCSYYDKEEKFIWIPPLVQYTEYGVFWWGSKCAIDWESACLKFMVPFSDIREAQRAGRLIFGKVLSAGTISRFMLPAARQSATAGVTFLRIIEEIVYNSRAKQHDSSSIEIAQKIGALIAHEICVAIYYSLINRVLSAQTVKLRDFVLDSGRLLQWNLLRTNTDRGHATISVSSSSPSVDMCQVLASFLRVEHLSRPAWKRFVRPLTLWCILRHMCTNPKNSVTLEALRPLCDQQDCLQYIAAAMCTKEHCNVFPYVVSETSRARPFRTLFEFRHVHFTHVHGVSILDVFNASDVRRLALIPYISATIGVHTENNTIFNDSLVQKATNGQLWTLKSVNLKTNAFTLEEDVVLTLGFLLHTKAKSLIVDTSTSFPSTAVFADDRLNIFITKGRRQANSLGRRWATLQRKGPHFALTQKLAQQIYEAVECNSV